jgi:hypothetical protein
VSERDRQTERERFKKKKKRERERERERSEIHGIIYLQSASLARSGLYAYMREN